MQGAVLRVRTQKPRRNRLLVAILLPAVVFLWIIGWSLYWIGHHRDNRKAERAKPSQENIDLEAILFDDQPEILVQ